MQDSSDRTWVGRSVALWGGLLASALLVGCASSKMPPMAATTAAPATTAAAPAAADTAGADAGTVAQSQVSTVDLTQQRGVEAAQSLGRYVYFAFDSALIEPQFKPLVDQHAQRLTQSGAHRLVVEGHTDERGGREYNLALGQRRAEAVTRSLVLLGAQRDQIEAVSFGKERPKAQGSNETAWTQNRRAVMVTPEG